MADTNHDDPFAVIVELCHISSSQEELLRRCSFVGETRPSPDHEPSVSSGGVPVASAGIVMVSLPETQDGGKDSTGPQDVFHSPAEESSPPKSYDQPRPMDGDPCTVNQVIHVDDNTLEFIDLCGYSEGTGYVDLGRDSDLGFSEVPLTQGIDTELVAECLRGIKGDGVSEISKWQFDKFGGLERELSLKDGLGELPLKKCRHSEQNSGLGSSRACFGIESQKIEEVMDNCEGKQVSETECNIGADLEPHKNVESKNIGSAGNFSFCEVDKLACAVEGNKSSDMVTEMSERHKRSYEQTGLRVLPSSLGGQLENGAKQLESGEGQKKDESLLFDVLRVIKENSDEDDLENVSLLEAVKSRGITFPRPRWWPDNDYYRKQRIV